MHGLQILKVKDKNEKHYKKKGDLFDLSFRLLICGKSFLSGKSNLICNLLLRDEDKLYKNEFKGENIYLVSPSAHTDTKMRLIIEEKDIPPCNVMTEFDDDIVDALYENCKDEYNEKVNNGDKPDNVLFIFDDMSAGGHLKKNKTGSLEKIFCNGRHILCSTIVTGQQYVQLPTCARENCTGAILFKCTDRQLDTITEEHNFLDSKKDFRIMFRKVTDEPHSFLCVNYSNPPEKMYMNKEFLPIGKCGGVKGRNCAC